MPNVPFSADACAKLVAATAKSCAPLPSPIPEPQHFDALAASFGALSSALTYGAIVIALITLLVGFAWGRYIAMEATKEALKGVREEVQRVTKAIMNEWLSVEGVAIIREARQMSQPTSAPGSADVADAIAAKAGEEPP